MQKSSFIDLEQHNEQMLNAFKTKAPKRSVLIIGAGISGATVARTLAENNFEVSVFESRPEVAGNIATTKEQGIHVHKYGAHIFHTSNKQVWDFVNKFGEFNTYRHHVIASSNDKIIPLPFSMFTFNAIWPEVQTPQQAKNRLELETKEFKDVVPTNLEEQALKLVGRTIYETLIRTYTEKQWGRPCTEIPASVIQRIPMRYTYDSNYFFDKYQGIPINGYSSIVENMLDHKNIEVFTEKAVDFWSLQVMKSVYDYIIFTGAVDELMEYQFGELEYRSLKFVHTIHESDNVTGHSVVNITDNEFPFTRTIEHRHFMQDCTSKRSIVTEEYPAEWKKGDERFYPIGDAANKELHKKYSDAFIETFGNKAMLLGRLAEYKYVDMHISVENALIAANKILSSVSIY